MTRNRKVAAAAAVVTALAAALLAPAGAAMFLNADVLEAPGVIAANTVQRLVACRMRFGDIGARRG